MGYLSATKKWQNELNKFVYSVLGTMFFTFLERYKRFFDLTSVLQQSLLQVILYELWD